MTIDFLSEISVCRPDLPHRVPRDGDLDRGQDARPRADRRAEDGPHRYHDPAAQALRHGAGSGGYPGIVVLYVQEDTI